ncbi:MAG: MarR family transcriptional regulator [Solirubrobacterales bacterium]|nr:MarR family transcriptional regulator [Solirubrobacterales bacterium]MBV9915859.1 MarR family transcriptional regulator [Solirubrobacterales bacterium]
MRANQRATAIVDDLASELMGINQTDGRALDLLDQHGRMSAGELARASGLSTGAVTAVVDRLERSGYAQRVPDPQDRRRVLVEMTAKAKATTEELFGPLADSAWPLLERWTDEQLEMLLEFLRLSRGVQEQHANWLRERLEDNAGGPA